MFKHGTFLGIFQTFIIISELLLALSYKKDINFIFCNSNRMEFISQTQELMVSLGLQSSKAFNDENPEVL